jgi:outer membrane protein assembly factor BamB
MIVFISDYEGVLHCLDAETGELYWTYNTKSHIWGSPLVVDGHVYLGNEDGIIFVLKASKELEEVETIEFLSPIYSSPIAANGVLFVATQSHLYAISSE